MTIKDFNLLEVDIYDGEKKIYNGMSEQVPNDLINKQIQVKGIDGKKLILKLA